MESGSRDLGDEKRAWGGQRTAHAGTCSSVQVRTRPLLQPSPVIHCWPCLDRLDVDTCHGIMRRFSLSLCLAICWLVHTPSRPPSPSLAAILHVPVPPLRRGLILAAGSLPMTPQGWKTCSLLFAPLDKTWGTRNCDGLGVGASETHSNWWLRAGGGPGHEMGRASIHHPCGRGESRRSLLCLCCFASRGDCIRGARPTPNRC